MQLDQVKLFWPEELVHHTEAARSMMGGKVDDDDPFVSRLRRRPERILTYFVRGSIAVRLVSYLTLK